MFKKITSFKRNISFLGIFNAFRYFKRVEKLKPVDILYSCTDNSRPILIDGKYHSPLIDSINVKLKNYSNYTLALPFSKYSGRKSSGNTINLNFYIIICLFRRLLSNGSTSLKNLKNDPLIKFYGYLFNKLNLKIIFGIQPSIEMCIAAKLAKIKIIDIQHGIITVDEENGYYSPKKRSQINNKGWPDYIFCRNKQSFKEVLKLKKYTNPLIIGNLNKFFFNKIYSNKQEGNIFKTKRKTFLFTFQPVYDTEHFSRENLHHNIIFPTALLELILSSNYNFILKLHPSQIQNKNLFKLHMSAFNKLFSENNNVDYIISNREPFEYSLSNSDIHITFNSASLFDAYDYGLKTILLDNNLSRLNSYYRELMISDFVIVNPDLDIDFDNHFKKNNHEEHLLNFNFKDFILENMKLC